MSDATPGRIVLYTLTTQGAAAIEGSNDRSNRHHEGDVLPMLIVRVCSVGVNGQVFIDRDGTHWVTSRAEGDGPGTWAGPAGSERGARGGCVASFAVIPDTPRMFPSVEAIVTAQADPAEQAVSAAERARAMRQRLDGAFGLSPPSVHPVERGSGMAIAACLV